MIYLEYTEQCAGHEPRAWAVELSVGTIAEAAKFFLAFEAGVTFVSSTELTLTSIGTAKSRGVKYERWAGL